MEVEVADGLSAVLSAVGDDAIAVVQIQFPRKLCDDGVNFSYNSTVFLVNGIGTEIWALGMTRK